jgi:5-formyltetrahydrofolate cyclo-ligase
MTKEEIRTIIRKRRDSLDSPRAKEASRIIQKHVIKLPEFLRAEKICCYMAVRTEVETDLIINRSLQDGKIVAVPGYCPDKKQYELYEMIKDAPCLKGMMGIPEPIDRRKVSFEGMGLFIVPGLAFDPEGGRLGHGQGHYDRILKDRDSVFKVGLAFDFQMFSQIPMDETDIKMNKIITESKN